MLKTRCFGSLYSRREGKEKRRDGEEKHRLHQGINKPRLISCEKGIRREKTGNELETHQKERGRGFPSENQMRFKIGISLIGVIN